MLEPHTNMLDVDFDRVLSILHGWLGESVNLGVEVTVQPLTVARMEGVLGAAHDIAAPYDFDEFEFTVGAAAGFALRRDYFAGANLFSDTARLLVSICDDVDDAEPRVTAIAHVVGPPVA
jgi:hypothetical protein